MRRLLFLFSLLLACDAYADRIQDYSLSPAETARQPSISKNSTQPLNPNNSFSSRNSRSMSGGIAPMELTPVTNDGTTTFMDGYCDPSFTPAIANDSHYAAIANCLRQQREQACAEFQQLPDDAKKLLSKTINCTAQLLNGEEVDEASVAGLQANCSGTDSARLQLAKKYWQEPSTAHALLFLPDEVMDNSSKCLRGGV